MLTVPASRAVMKRLAIDSFRSGTGMSSWASSSAAMKNTASLRARKARPSKNPSSKRPRQLVVPGVQKCRRKNHMTSKSTAWYRPVSSPFMLCRVINGAVNHSAAATRARRRPCGRWLNTLAATHARSPAETAAISVEKRVTRTMACILSPCARACNPAKRYVAIGWTPLVAMVPSAVDMPNPIAMLRATVCIR